MQDRPRRPAPRPPCRGAPLLAAAGWLCAAAAAAAQPAAAPAPPPACDPAWAAAARAAGTTDDHDGADGVVVFDRSTVRVQESGQAHVVRTRLQKALTEPGAGRLAVQRFDYDPATSLLELRRVTVVHADGSCTEVPFAERADLPQPATSIYWDLRMQLVQVPRPAVGDAVLTETYYTGFQIAYLDQPQDDERFAPPMHGHFYDSVLFADEPWPVLEKSYEVSTPRSRPLQYETYGPPVSVAATFDEQAFHYAFRATDLPALAEEPGAPWISDFLPKVVMATVPDWPAKSRWFFEANEAQFAANDEIRAAVERITAGARTDEERVAALNSWVAHNIRYRGMSTGPEEGYTMHASTMTFDHRAGVCKDKAGMLVTMLRVAGFTAYPAMTMAGSRVERIAADQFNHAVVAWRQADGSYRMVDPTWAPFSRDLWSRAESSQHFLVGSPAGEDLALTPAEGPERNGLELRGTARLAEDGTLVGSVRITPLGALEDRLRRTFGRASLLETRHQVEEIAQRLAPAAEVADHRMVDPFELEPRFFVEFEYRAERHAAAGPDVMRLTFPLARHPFGTGRLADYLQAVKGAKRQTPVLLRSAQTVAAEERIRLPDGWNLAEPLDRAVDGGVAAFEAHVTQEGRELVLRTRTTINQRNIGVAEYAGLADVVGAARALADTAVILERTVRRTEVAR
jgi:transglutaminase-like putative cysteine protease